MRQGTRRGCIGVRALFIVPPDTGLWVPAGTTRAVCMADAARMLALVLLHALFTASLNRA